MLKKRRVFQIGRPLRAMALMLGLIGAIILDVRAGEAEPVEIAMWGDSLTQGKGASDPLNAYPAQACRMIGDCVAQNRGWGGQGSSRIAARQGARDISVTLRDGIIPADPNPVRVVAPSVDVLQMGGRPAGSLPGSLGGIHGTLTTDPDGRWSFLRSAAGPALLADAPLPFIPDDAVQLQQAETWIWAGRNNFRKPDVVLRDIAAMVAHLGHDRFLVGEILPSTRDTPEALAVLAALNSELAQRYGDHFVRLIGPLQAMATAEDAADLAKGIVPSSLRSDHVHLNDAGYRIVAAQFVAAWRARR